MIRFGRWLWFWKQDRVKYWAQDHVASLMIMNIILMLMILLRTAGYFEPYLALTINLIVMVSIILGVIFLSLGSRVLVIMAMLLWILSAVLRLLKVEIWAERSSIYVYEALVVALVVLIFETLRIKSSKK